MKNLTCLQLREILRREYDVSSPKKLSANVMRQQENVVQKNSEEPENLETEEVLVQLIDPTKQLIHCPPNKCTKGLFMANNPFIQIRSTTSTQQNHIDKFGGSDMDSDTLFSFMQAFERDVLQASFSVGDAMSQQGSQEIHKALFRGLSKVTRPSLDLLYDLELRQRDYEREHKCKRPRYQAMCGQKGYHLETPPQADNEEEKEEEQAGDKGWGFMDFFGSVEDFRPINHPPLVASQRFNPKKYVIVEERKWEKDHKAENGVYQGGCYCVQGVRANLLCGHKNPMYDLVVCSNKWTYAKLEVRGVIQIGEDGEVSENSYRDYAILEKKMGYTEREELSYAQLRGLLESSRMFAKSRYPDYFKSNEQVKYPKGTYIVGDFFVAPKWFDLPNARQFYTLDGRKFYEGLLRIFLGDSVLNWTSDDVQSVRELNQAVLGEFQFLLRNGRQLSGQKRKA